MGPEAKLDQKIREYAKSKGVTSIKLTTVGPGMGTAGWPDRLYLAPGGKVMFMEMKAYGKTCTEIQLHRQQELRDLGFDVRVVDEVTVGKKLIDQLLTGRKAKAPMMSNPMGGGLT